MPKRCRYHQKRPQRCRHLLPQARRVCLPHRDPRTGRPDTGIPDKIQHITIQTTFTKVKRHEENNRESPGDGHHPGPDSRRLPALHNPVIALNPWAVVSMSVLSGAML